MFHLALLSVGFSQQDSCVHLAMLSGYRHIDIHHRGPRAEEWAPSGGLNRGYVFSKIIVICQETFIVFVATNFGEKRPLCLIFHGIAGFSPWKIRYSIAGGLGALAYDATRNAIWAGWGGGAGGAGVVRLIALDASKSGAGVNIAGNVSSDPGVIVCGLDDGLAYDGQNDTLYFSDDCSTTIFHYGITLAAGPAHGVTGMVGAQLDNFAWGGSGCDNSGLAI